MNFKLIKNEKLDMSFLKDTLSSKEEMVLVNPSANFPFQEEYWLNFYKLQNRKSVSLHYLHNDKIIAHAALQENEGIVHLCFVVVAKEYRGKGITGKFLKEVEDYLIKTFKVNEYFLNVRKENISAIKCYEKFGFLKWEDRGSSIKMVKNLKNTR